MNTGIWCCMMAAIFFGLDEARVMSLLVLTLESTEIDANVSMFVDECVHYDVKEC